MSDEMLTTVEAAERLGISAERVRQLIKAGRLPSKQFGRDHVIRESDLELVADRKTGRPPKDAQAPSSKPAKAIKTSSKSRTEETDVRDEINERQDMEQRTSGKKPAKKARAKRGGK